MLLEQAVSSKTSPSAPSLSASESNLARARAKLVALEDIWLLYRQYRGEVTGVNFGAYFGTNALLIYDQSLTFQHQFWIAHGFEQPFTYRGEIIQMSACFFYSEQAEAVVTYYENHGYGASLSYCREDWAGSLSLSEVEADEEEEAAFGYKI